MAKTSSYRDDLLESLADPQEAELYLNAVLEDYPEGFLKALRNVAQSQGKMSRVAEDAGIKRESLYRALSAEGNPRWETFTSIIRVLGLGIKVVAPHKSENPSPTPVTQGL